MQVGLLYRVLCICHRTEQAVAISQELDAVGTGQLEELRIHIDYDFLHHRHLVHPSPAASGTQLVHW